MISRKDMIQLSEKDLQNSEFAYIILTVKVSSIKPVQEERLPLSKKYFDRFIKVLNNTHKPLIIDENFILIDGHHRLDVLRKLKRKETKVIKIYATFKEILNAFKNSS
jgi:hypothetical protein